MVCLFIYFLFKYCIQGQLNSMVFFLHISFCLTLIDYISFSALNLIYNKIFYNVNHKNKLDIKHCDISWWFGDAVRNITLELIGHLLRMIESIRWILPLSLIITIVILFDVIFHFFLQKLVQNVIYACLVIQISNVIFTGLQDLGQE